MNSRRGRGRPGRRVLKRRSGGTDPIAIGQAGGDTLRSSRLPARCRTVHGLRNVQTTLPLKPAGTVMVNTPRSRSRRSPRPPPPPSLESGTAGGKKVGCPPSYSFGLDEVVGPERNLHDFLSIQIGVAEGKRGGPVGIPRTSHRRRDNPLSARGRQRRERSQPQLRAEAGVAVK